VRRISCSYRSWTVGRPESITPIHTPTHTHSHPLTPTHPPTCCKILVHSHCSSHSPRSGPDFRMRWFCWVC